MKKLLTIALSALVALAGCETDGWDRVPTTTEGTMAKMYETITWDMVGAVENYTAAWEKLEAANFSGMGQGGMTVAEAQKIWRDFCDSGDAFVEVLGTLGTFEEGIPEWKTRLYHGGEATYNALYYGGGATRWNPKRPWIANVMDDYVGPVIDDISSFVLGEADEDAAVTATRETVYQIGKFVDDNVAVESTGVSVGLAKDVAAEIDDARTKVAALESKYQQEAKTDEVAATENLYTGYGNLQREKMKDVANFGVGAVAGTVAGGLAGAALAAAAAPAALVIVGGAAAGAAVGWFVKWYTDDTRAGTGVNYLMVGRTKLGEELPLQYIPEGATLTLAIEGYAPIVFEDFQHPGAGQDGIMAVSRIPISEVGKEGVVPYIAYYRYKRGSLGTGSGGGDIVGKWWLYSEKSSYLNQPTIYQKGDIVWEFHDNGIVTYWADPWYPNADFKYTYDSETGKLTIYEKYYEWEDEEDCAEDYTVESLTATEMVQFIIHPSGVTSRYTWRKY